MSNPPLEPEYAAAAQHLWYGHRKLRRPSELELCWKAAKAIAAGDARLNEDERSALIGKMCATAVPQEIIDAVMAWDERTGVPAELMAHLHVTPETRLELGLWVVYEGLCVAFADGDLALGERNSVHAVAATMGVPTSTVEALITVCRDEALLRLRRVKTLQGRIAVALTPVSPVVESYELVPATVRAEDLRRAG
jgi:hypothetical protein